MNNETEIALLELEHRYGKEVRDRVEQMGFVIPKTVWCQNCEHWYTEEDEDDEYGYCRNHEFWTCGIWFCADGERREE